MLYSCSSLNVILTISQNIHATHTYTTHTPNTHNQTNIELNGAFKRVHILKTATRVTINFKNGRCYSVAAASLTILNIGKLFLIMVKMIVNSLISRQLACS